MKFCCYVHYSLRLTVPPWRLTWLIEQDNEFVAITTNSRTLKGIFCTDLLPSLHIKINESAKPSRSFQVDRKPAKLLLLGLEQKSGFGSQELTLKKHLQIWKLHFNNCLEARHEQPYRALCDRVAFLWPCTSYLNMVSEPCTISAFCLHKWGKKWSHQKAEITAVSNLCFQASKKYGSYESVA